MQNSKIEWTDKTWNPVTGCTKVSQGCKNCYAEKIYERFNGKGSFKEVVCHEDRLMQPFHWKQPALVFVNSMSDLFHEDVPFEFIRKVLKTIYDKPTHTFQILTKRPERMYDFFKWLNNSNIAVNFPNMWLGVSVEDQKAADERIPLLLLVPAAVRFLSCEPLLGPVDLKKWLPLNLLPGYDFDIDGQAWKGGKLDPDIQLNWVICGGESGNKARPIHPDWAITLRDQCQAADVPFFFKQWGEYYPNILTDGTKPSISVDSQTLMARIGKKQAGRLLDGKEYNEFPKTI